MASQQTEGGEGLMVLVLVHRTYCRLEARCHWPDHPDVIYTCRLPLSSSGLQCGPPDGRLYRVYAHWRKKPEQVHRGCVVEGDTDHGTGPALFGWAGEAFGIWAASVSAAYNPASI